MIQTREYASERCTDVYIVGIRLEFRRLYDINRAPETDVDLIQYHKLLFERTQLAEPYAQ